jgi:hypothetical protein
VSIDVSELLLDDADAAPSEPLMGDPPKRGRGRPRGSTTKPKSHGAAASVAGTRELAQGMAKAIGVLSVVLATWLLEMPEAALTPLEANDIAKPAARLLAKSQLGQWLIRLLTGSAMGGDAGKLTWALLLYGWRIAPLVQLRYQELEFKRKAQRERPYGTGHTGEDAGVWAAQPKQEAARPSATAHANGDANRDAAARATADALQFGGLGFADPDALAARAYGEVAGNLRGVSQQ